MTMQTTLRPMNGSDLELSVSDTTARSGPFTKSDVTIYCDTACFIKLGGSTVEASTSDYDKYIPAGLPVDISNGGNTYMAVILASGTDTAYINEWSKKAE